MTRKGRKPLGLAHVDQLSASDLAKERLKAILATISGDVTIPEASAELGICESRFHVLRHAFLEASAVALEPQRMGRPPKPSPPVNEEELARLQAENQSLRHQLQVAVVREEIAAVLPQMATPSAEAPKKTTSSGYRARRSCRQGSSRQRKRQRPR